MKGFCAATTVCVYTLAPLVAASRRLGGRDPTCVGGKLEAGRRLYPSQFICSGETDQYKIGLESKGYFVQYGDGHGPAGEKSFSTEESGSYLVMEHDGSITLRDDEGNTVWTSNCYAEGAYLGFSDEYPNLGAGTYIPNPPEGYTGEVWSVDSWDGETSCNPPIHCRGSVLLPGETLRRDEYLCPQNGWQWEDSYRFGLNNVGKLVLLLGKYDEQIIWSPTEVTRGAVKLENQRGGNLVLRDNDGNVLWASGCKSQDSSLKMRSGGIFKVTDTNEISFFIDYSGFKSKCFPGESTVPLDMCAKVSRLDGRACRMRMWDSFNEIDTTVQVRNFGNGKYTVTDNYNNKKERWVVHLEKTESGSLLIDAGVPEVTCSELMNGRWTMRNDTQLTYYSIPSHPCTQFGQTLISYMINEWFYFG